MDEEKIKEAFSKAKEDIFSLGKEIGDLKILISDMKNELKILTQAFKDSQNPEEYQEKTPKTQENIPTHTPTDKQKTPTIQQITPTHEETPTDKLLSQVLKGQNMHVSTGNRGVPTNKQTNKQTNQQIIQHINLPQETEINPQLTTTKPQITQESKELTTTKAQERDQLERASEILNSLDSLKKELRLKFKRLTSQELAVFSMLYSLENQGLLVDYPLLAEKLKLSEASIRDYIGKIKKKGIIINKEKLNNKKVILHISPDLKKIASLDTILKLREL